MASQPIMGSVSALPAAPPMPAVARILSRFDRWQVEGFIAVALELLDAIDGDSDVELNGDEQDSDGDEKGDQAWVEWTTMHGSQKHGPNRLAGEEDDEEDDAPEDDDPAGQCDEDGINCGAGHFWMHGNSYDCPGCYISEPGI